MGKYILKVEANCKDQAREAEFNDWYNNIHIPDVLETKGFVRSIRYELLEPAPDKGRYVAVHEIETDDLDDLFARHGANMKNKESLGRITDLITVTSRGIYKQIYSREAKS
jgi:hypothetical protein